MLDNHKCFENESSILIEVPSFNTCIHFQKKMSRLHKIVEKTRYINSRSFAGLQRIVGPGFPCRVLGGISESEASGQARSISK